MPATLPHHLGSHCLHAAATPRLAPREPGHPLQPRAQAAPAGNSVHARPAIASSRSQSFERCGVRLRFSDVSSSIGSRLGASDPAPAAPIKLPARPVAPQLAPSKTPPPASAPLATATAHNTKHHRRKAGGCKLPLTAQRPPMHAAYHRAPATSATSSFRDSVPATLPHHLGSHCLHAPPPLGPLLANPIIRYSPACNRLSHQPTTNSFHSRQSQLEASAHSAAHADERSLQLRSSDVSCVI